MKIRNGFVSNSSSSSFTVSVKHLTPLQKVMIEKHIQVDAFLRELDPEYAEEMHEPTKYDQWSISVDDDILEGYTNMANFDMRSFLSRIGVSSAKFEDD